MPTHEPKYKAKYIRKEGLWYYSIRYEKGVFVEKGFQSDGATFATDIKNSISWWVHDKVKETGKFYDGTPCTNWQASMILYDILKDEGRQHKSRFRRITRNIRAPLWLIGTLMWGEFWKVVDRA